MSEFESIGRVIPGDRSQDRPRKRPPQRKFEEDDNPDEPLDPQPEGEPEDSPPDGSKKNRKGREIAPPGRDEEGQIIDILA